MACTGPSRPLYALVYEQMRRQGLNQMQILILMWTGGRLTHVPTTAN